MAMYKINSGVFASAQFAGNFASDEVPNFIQVKLGYAASLFSADAFAANQTSTSGVDILGEFH
jgi:hypothetical protein